MPIRHNQNTTTSDLMLRGILMMLVLCGLGLPGLGQEVYRAVFSGGRVYQATENRFSQIENGQIIPADARLELVGNSLLVLMDNSGRLSSLSLNGKYDLSNLEMSAVADSSAFVKSVWDIYYAKMDEAITTEEQILMQAARELPTIPFELSVPSSVQVFGNEVRLWWSSAGQINYKAELINEFDEVFQTIDCFGPELELDLFSPELVWKAELTFRVKSEDGTMRSPLYTLDKLSPPDYESMDRLMRQHFEDSSFAMLLTRAAFFENEWLFADAQTILLKLRGEKGDLMDGFWQQYLERNGFYAMSSR